MFSVVVRPHAIVTPNPEQEISSSVPIRSGTVRAYTIPTDAPEADGTIAWDSTTMIVVEVQAGDESGLGYTYAHRTAAMVAQE